MANRQSTANLISRGAAFAHALTARLPVHPLSPFRRRRSGVTKALKPASLLLVAAVLIVFIAVDAASSPVQAQTPSADASLKSLSLSDSVGDDIELSATFSAATTSYTASVESSVTSTTVTAETTNEDATAVIKINGVEDADGTVDLVAGYNVITVEVTAEDGTTTQTYTVTVLRAQRNDTFHVHGRHHNLPAVPAGRRGLNETVADIGFTDQQAGISASGRFPRRSLSPAGFNYPAGFGPLVHG